MLYYYDYAYINSGTGKTNVWLKKKDQEWGCLEVGLGWRWTRKSLRNCLVELVIFYILIGFAVT